MKRLYKLQNYLRLPNISFIVIALDGDYNLLPYRRIFYVPRHFLNST